MYGVEELLLNVLFLIVFLLFIPIVLGLNASTFFNVKKSWIIKFSAAFAIISCMNFPIALMEGYFFDMRIVALTIGGLYGGIPTVLFLAAVTIGFRFFIGGSGALATTILIVTFTFFLSLCTKTFHTATRKKRIFIGTALSIFGSSLAIVNSTVIFNVTLNPVFIGYYLSLTLITTAILMYIYEVFQEHLLMNKRMIKAEKMEVVSHLASSISHEVRNPLTVVRGFLQMMLQENIAEEKRKEYLRISIEELDRANDIIRHYLTFAKPSPENRQILNVKEEIQKTLQIITPLANYNGVTIRTKLDDLYTVGEDQLFQQCLINLTKNCIEAMPNKGELAIETSSNGHSLFLFISDNGQGMTREQLARIGEPYFTTKGREGTGLGMMVSIKIIEAMGGKLSVTSKVNEGTQFMVRLPFVPPSSEEKPVEES